MSNDPNRRKPNKPQPGGDDENRKARRIVVLIVAALIATLLINSLYTTISNAYLTVITYTEFKELLSSGQISEVEFQSDDRIVILTKDQAEKPKSQQRLYYTGLIPNQDTTSLTNQLDTAGVKYNRDLPEEVSPIVTFLVSWVLPVVFMYALFSLLMRGMTKKMGGGLGGIGESKAKVYMEKQTGVTFADVAGQDEAKESLVEIIDFLHNPQKYTAIGAKLPKGALLVGSPGTGKTLLAKAVAGEANVPFFSISGSDFVEMFVGVGASRVRDLFQQAAKVAPAIIFIDEIDAIGRTRDSKFGGNDEREQTLNQLLAEIDGFDSSKGVVILAATNRPEILDKALLRAGRFDRRIIVDRPNLQGRYQTLRVHTKNIKLAEDVDLHTVAQATVGFTGADLENLVNEAALLAARQGKKAITEKEIEEASVKVMMGPEKKSHVVTDEERRLTAYHETGHAITGYFSKHHDPVHQISIISRGGAGGYTMYLPEKDRSSVTKNIVTLLGGRVAEQLVLEDISTGASSDLQRATDTARAMVTRYGFSERMGPVVYGSDPGETFLGRDFGQGKGYSEAIASEIDNEIRDIVDEAYETARRTLTEHMNELHKVAGVLMEREKISGEEFKTLMEGGTLPPYDLGRGETAQPEAPAPDSAAPVQPAEQPETQQPAEPANPQPDTQE